MPVETVEWVHQSIRSGEGDRNGQVSVDLE
jgi:hypothetical protein